MNKLMILGVLALTFSMAFVSAGARDGIGNNIESNGAFAQCTYGPSLPGAWCNTMNEGLPRFTVFNRMQVPGDGGEHANENSVVDVWLGNGNTRISPLGQI